MPVSRVGAKELLGPWFTQVAILIGMGILIATTIGVRALLPRLKRSRQLARGVPEALARIA